MPSGVGGLGSADAGPQQLGRGAGVPRDGHRVGAVVGRNDYL